MPNKGFSKRWRLQQSPSSAGLSTRATLGRGVSSIGISGEGDREVGARRAGLLAQLAGMTARQNDMDLQEPTGIGVLAAEASTDSE